MLEGADLLMGRKFVFIVLLIFSPSSLALGQSEKQWNEPNIFAVVKDGEGKILEGYLRVQPEEVTVSSKDEEEKKIPSKYIKSITLERIKEEGPASIDPKQEPRYFVRLENTQEVYTLRKKYTFSLNTSLGVVTRSLDPETIKSVLSKYASPDGASDKEKPFIQDEGIVFSLEFKF
jgi:hypothetical protein